MSSKPVIDVSTLPTSRTPISWNKRDVILYALGIGASELKFTYENDPSFQVLPTYPINISMKGTSQDVTDFVEMIRARTVTIPGVKANLKGMVAGDLTLEFPEPLPVHCDNAVLESKTTGVWDGGKHCITDSENVLKDGSGKVLFRQSGCGFMLGAGGFGGPKRPLDPLDTLPKPKGQPHKTVELQTDIRQAMIFRLTGDYNRGSKVRFNHGLRTDDLFSNAVLSFYPRSSARIHVKSGTVSYPAHHVDPVVTKENGYDTPILHGPCTIGFATRAIALAYCGNSPHNLEMVHCRFSSPVIPGDLLRTEIWDVTEQDWPLCKENKAKGLRTVKFRTMVKDREVVGNGVATMLL